ncbi:hypothetical protein SUGI_1108450 [Cryptomeria japonica]|nr:hypothetical protein SUGI_1108450 [Cryptomeria japonica]
MDSQSSTKPLFPELPIYNDTSSMTTFNQGLRSLTSQENSVDVPQNIDENFVISVGIGLLPCRTNMTMTCQGPSNTRVTANMNSVSFDMLDIVILQAYYFSINGVFTTDFPSN